MHRPMNLAGGCSSRLLVPGYGGYVGKCVVIEDIDGCFDVYIWHDGHFALPRMKKAKNQPPASPMPRNLYLSLDEFVAGIKQP